MPPPPFRPHVRRLAALAAENARLRVRLAQSEAARHDAEGRYSLLSGAAFDGLIVLDNARHVAVNDTFAAMVGYGRAELLGRSAWETLAPTSREAFLRHVAEGSDEPYEIVGIRKDGSTIDLEARGRTLARGGRHLRAVAIRDVTERKRADAALRASRDELAVILRGVTDGITAMTPGGRLIYANEAAARILGFETAEALLAASLPELLTRFDVFHEDGRPMPPDDLPTRRALAGELVVGVPVCFRYRDRPHEGERWSLVTSTPVPGHDGTSRFVITIFRDITGQRQSETRLHFLAEAGATLPASLDVAATLDGITRGAVSTLADWSVAQVVGPGGEIDQISVATRDPACQPAADAIREQRVTAAEDSLLWRVLREGSPLLLSSLTEEVVADAIPDPRRRELVRGLGLTSAMFVPLVARGRTLGALALFLTDPHHRYGAADLGLAEEIGRRAALAIDNARLYQEAQEAIRARDEFLSIASHELRTPITAIKGTAQMLARALGRGPIEQTRLRRFLGAFVEGSERLTALTDDLLDIAQLRTGHLTLTLEPVDLGVLARAVAERLRPELSARHVLAFEIAPGCEVMADRTRLDQALDHLIANAVKYSPAGGPVQIIVRRADDGVLVVVRDEGIGLPPGEGQTIFQPFGRASNAAEHQIQGMGLGLHVTRGIVERHGGRVWAESPGLDRGTSLYVWLPSAARMDAAMVGVDANE